MIIIKLIGEGFLRSFVGIIIKGFYIDLKNKVFQSNSKNITNSLPMSSE